MAAERSGQPLIMKENHTLNLMGSEK